MKGAGVPTDRRAVAAWDASVAVEELGGGSHPVTLFLHSEEGPDHDQPFARAIAESHRVLLPSHPGFGGQPRVTGIDRPVDLAYLYLALLDACAVDACVLVGASLGAWIALEMAAMEPRRFSVLVAISPIGLKFNGRTDRSFAEVLVGSPDAISKLLYSDTAHDIWRDRKEADAVTRRAEQRESLLHYGWEPYLHSPRLRHLLARVAMPTLLVAGADDGLIPDGYYAAVAGALPDARVVSIPDAGHFPQIEQPAMTISHVVQFISGGAIRPLNLSAKGPRP
jgi:pimeloyl-ACP methyl ester carboxylesterase